MLILFITCPTHIYNDKERLRIEHETAQAEKFAKLDEIIDLMNKNSSDMGITLFMPHVAKDAFRKTLETAKWLSLVNRAGKMIQITPDMMETLNYNLENPIDERILDEIFYKDIFAVLWYMDPRTAVTDALEEFVKRVSEPIEYEVEGEENVWETLLEPLVIDLKSSERGSLQSVKLEATDSIEEKSVTTLNLESAAISNITLTQGSASRLSKRQPSVREQSMRFSAKERRSKYISQIETDPEFEDRRESEKVDDGLLTIPPVWTPKNQSGNAIFMHEFFRNVSMGTFINDIQI